MPYSYIQLLETPMQMYALNSNIYTYRHSYVHAKLQEITRASNVCCTSVKHWFVPLLPVIIYMRSYLATDLSFTRYGAALQVNKVAHVYFKGALAVIELLLVQQVVKIFIYLNYSKIQYKYGTFYAYCSVL